MVCLSRLSIMVCLSSVMDVWMQDLCYIPVIPQKTNKVYSQTAWVIPYTLQCSVFTYILTLRGLVNVPVNLPDTQRTELCPLIPWSYTHYTESHSFIRLPYSTFIHQSISQRTELCLLILLGNALRDLTLFVFFKTGHWVTTCYIYIYIYT